MEQLTDESNLKNQNFLAMYLCYNTWTTSVNLWKLPTCWAHGFFTCHSDMARLCWCGKCCSDAGQGGGVRPSGHYSILKTEPGPNERWLPWLFSLVLCFPSVTDQMLLTQAQQCRPSVPLSQSSVRIKNDDSDSSDIGGAKTVWKHK